MVHTPASKTGTSKVTRSVQGKRGTWTITYGSETRTLVSSKKSAEVMGRVAEKYSRALKRLADR